MNLLQKIITAFKRMLRGHITVYVVDTSAWSNHFDTVKKYLEKDNNHKIILPEAVLSEISAGKQKGIPKCIAIYNFFQNNISGYNKNPRIIVKQTPDEQKGWESKDDVIIAAARACQKDGYTTKLVTSDSPEGLKAGAIYNIETIVLKVNRNSIGHNSTKTPKKDFASKNEFVRQSMYNNIPKEEKTINSEITLNCKKQGKETWIAFDKNVYVQDANGKRKIFPKDGMRIADGDTFYFKGIECAIKSITSSSVILQPKKSG